MKKLFFIGLIVILAACAAPVGIDFNKATDFSQYTSYNYYPEISSGLNDLDNKRVTRAIDSVMSLRGITKSDTPDFLINFYAEEAIAQSRNTIGIGVGSGGRNGGVGISGGIPIGGRTIEQRFTFDIIEARKDDLLWQGVIDSRMSEKMTPAKKEKHYNYIIAKILSKYPPKAK